MNTIETPVVGFILKGFPRLSETFILNEILLLEKLGNRLHIFALRNPGESEVHERVKQVKARVTYIPDYFWTSFFSLMGTNIRLGSQRPRVYWNTFKHAVRHSVRSWNIAPLKRFIQAGYLVQKVLPGTDVIHFHAHFSHDPTTVAYFASQLTGNTYSFSAHAKDIYVQERKFLYEKIHQAQFVVTCTDFNRRYLQEVGGSQARVMTCYHGVDLDFFSGSARLNPDHSGCPRILSIGRFVHKKGFSSLIHALHVLREKGYAFDCHIIGNGPLQGALQAQITESGLEEYIKLLPPLSQDELIAHYQRAAIFALACEVQQDGDRDGIPNVIVEAMAMGVPVVSTNISGIPEGIENEVNGLLVPERESHALADALATLLDSPMKRRQFGLAGRRKVERDFDSLKNITQISDALRSVISARWSEKEPIETVPVSQSYSFTFIK